MPDPTIDPTFGVLLTGYLLKQTSRKLKHSYSRRFLVLTNVGLHWFKRSEGYDLFGEETGCCEIEDVVDVVPASDLLSAAAARKIEEDKPQSPQPKTPPAVDPKSEPPVTIYTFIVSTTDGYKRTFRCPSVTDRDRWVDTINMIKHQQAGESVRSRKGTLAGLDFAPHAASAQRSDSLVPGSDEKALKSQDSAGFLYHSKHGGACYAGGAPPVPTAIMTEGRVVASSFTSLWDAKFGVGSNATTIVRRKAVPKKKNPECFSPNEGIQILLSNGGMCNITDAEIDVLAASNSTGGEKVKRTEVKVTGMKYPGDPQLLAKVEVSLVKKKNVEEKGGGLMMISVPIMILSVVGVAVSFLYGKCVIFLRS